MLMRSAYNHIFFGYVHGHVMGAANQRGYQQPPGEPGGPYGAITAAVISFYALDNVVPDERMIKSGIEKYRDLRREFEDSKTQLYEYESNSTARRGN